MNEDGEKMTPIKLGHTYKAKPYFVLLMNSIGGIPQQQNQHTKARGKTLYGKCVFVHPDGRFVTLEFPVRGGVIRECFKPEEVS